MSSYQIFFCLKYYIIIVILKYNHRNAIYILYKNSNKIKRLSIQYIKEN